jgi:hypothetical protein
MSEAADVNLSLVANVWIKELRFRHAGDLVASHAHSFDHQTLLAKGRLRVFVDERHVRDFTAPAIIVVRAGTEHVLHALEDDTVAYCIHALRSSERAEDIVDPGQDVTIDEAYPLVAGMANSELRGLA